MLQPCTGTGDKQGGILRLAGGKCPGRCVSLAAHIGGSPCKECPLIHDRMPAIQSQCKLCVRTSQHIIALISSNRGIQCTGSKHWSSGEFLLCVVFKKKKKNPPFLKITEYIVSPQTCFFLLAASHDSDENALFKGVLYGMSATYCTQIMIEVRVVY